MKQWLNLLFLLISVCGCTPAEKSADKMFRFHLFHEPLHLDPARLRASSANYFFYNIFRGLYRIDKNNELVEEGGSCQWSSALTLKCQIKNQMWSTGESVSSEDYKRSFLRLIDPQTASPRAHLLGELRNGREILMGLKNKEALGFEVLSKNQFRLHFVKPDREFLFKLASTALYPLHKNILFKKEDFKNKPTNGPYKITQWQSGEKLTLSPNPHYKSGHPKRPQIEVFFVEEDKTALRLYEKKKLNFLRRIPSQFFPKMLTRKDFIQVPMLRFDYIGFGGKLLKNQNLRQALALSIDYDHLKKLLHALGRPGCPSIPRDWYLKDLCYPLDMLKAQSSLKKIKSKKVLEKLILKVSQLGGEDIKKQAEFFQNQWKTHLNLPVEIGQIEQKVFLNELRTSPPPLFRKGVGLDRPTCLNALETFAQDSKQNFIQMKRTEYQDIIDKMKITKNKSKYKELCQQGIQYLMDRFLVIPLGEMYFGMLTDNQFSGWSVNGLNQLDLSQLHPNSQK